MRNCSFNLFGVNSNMHAWEKENEYMVSHSFHYFFIKCAKKTNSDNGSYFIYSNTSLSYFAQVYFPREQYSRVISSNVSCMQLLRVFAKQSLTLKVLK